MTEPMDPYRDNTHDEAALWRRRYERLRQAVRWRIRARDILVGLAGFALVAGGVSAVLDFFLTGRHLFECRTAEARCVQELHGCRGSKWVTIDSVGPMEWYSTFAPPTDQTRAPSHPPILCDAAHVGMYYQVGRGKTINDPPDWAWTCTRSQWTTVVYEWRQ